MRLHCPPDLIDRIIVIDNSNTLLSPAKRDRILEQYGTLKQFVDFLAPKDIAQIPKTSGWWSQQVLKLAVSDIVSSERYVVLDAKNHLVSALGRDFLEAPSGQARVNFHSFETHPLRHSLEHVLKYLSLDPGAVRKFTATTTPFVIYTGIARRLMSELSQRENMPFADLMVARQLTEFFLYSAYIEFLRHEYCQPL